MKLEDLGNLGTGTVGCLNDLLLIVNSFRFVLPAALASAQGLNQFGSATFE
jgi:hypothetical protein